MEKLLAVIYDSTQRTISDWIIKEGGICRRVVPSNVTMKG